MQDAVDPVADADDFLERLDVDIRGPKLNGLLDHELDQADDRGAVFIDDFSRADCCGGRFGLGKVDFRVGELLQHRVRRLTLNLAVVLVDGFQDLVAWGQRDFDAAVENKPQFFDRVDVVGVTDDDLQGVVFFSERQDRVFAGDRLRNQLDDRLRDRNFRQIHIVAAMLLGHGPHDVFTRGVA